jgi:hypothetical protein
VDREFYYSSVDKMQKMQVDAEYIQGWIGGYMGNPKREEQRITDAYEAGYEDGGDSDVSKLDQWVKG